MEEDRRARFVRAVRATVALLFVGLFIWEAAAAQTLRVLQAAHAIVTRGTGGPEPTASECLERHPLDPGLCAVAASERAAVEWLVDTFEPSQLPIPYSEDVRELVRMRYYARAGWNRRREAHCVLYYSRGGTESLWGWLAWSRTAAVGRSSLLTVPDGAGSAGSSREPLALSDALGICRGLEGVESARLVREEALETCRRVPGPLGSTLEVLGLGGITLSARTSATAPRVSADALVVTAGVAIEAVALLLTGPDGEEVGEYTAYDVGAFAHEVHWEQPLEGERPAGRWRVKACVVDSEGFPRAVAVEVQMPPP